MVPAKTMPLFKLKTIEEGRAALVRNHLGEAHLVNGPARLTLWRSKVEMLELHYAGEGQYLEVNQRAGPRLCLTVMVMMVMMMMMMMMVMRVNISR